MDKNRKYLDNNYGGTLPCVMGEGVPSIYSADGIGTTWYAWSPFGDGSSCNTLEGAQAEVRRLRELHSA